MQLIYRGHTHTVDAPTSATYRKPNAINWRYQVPGETYGDRPVLPQRYQHPRALNWRWQVSNSDWA